MDIQNGRQTKTPNNIATYNVHTNNHLDEYSIHSAEKFYYHNFHATNILLYRIEKMAAILSKVSYLQITVFLSLCMIH